MRGWGDDSCSECDRLVGEVEALMGWNAVETTRFALWRWWEHCYREHRPALDKPEEV